MNNENYSLRIENKICMIRISMENYSTVICLEYATREAAKFREVLPEANGTYLKVADLQNIRSLWFLSNLKTLIRINLMAKYHVRDTCIIETT